MTSIRPSAEDMGEAYRRIIVTAKESAEAVNKFLLRELPPLWRDAYESMSSRPTEIVVFRYDTFNYWFDAHQDASPFDPNGQVAPVEARLVAAIGTSKPKRTKRDDNRLRGVTLSAWSGAKGPWDRGHFIGHSIGGTVDGNEANVFLQLRSANRGRYRSMENYCRQHPGVLCFSRPIYLDTSAHPYFVEFGILKLDRDFWVETLPNR